jgi:hypothetical protein
MPRSKPDIGPDAGDTKRTGSSYWENRVSVVDVETKNPNLASDAIASKS